MKTAIARSLDEDWYVITRKLEKAVMDEKGVTFESQEAWLLLMKLRSSVDLAPLVSCFHDLIMHTLAIWKERRPSTRIGDIVKHAPEKKE